MQLTVIEAGLEQLNQVAHLFDQYRQFYQQPPDIEGAYEFIKCRITQGESKLYLAQDEAKQALGFVQLYPTFSSVSMQRSWLLNDLFVAPQCRGSGVATALLNKAKSLGITSRAKELTLCTANDNHKAKSLYQSHHYQMVTDFVFYKLKLPQ